MPDVKPPRPPLAVVGVSALFPGSTDETGFWRDILAGRDLIREVPPSHWLIEDYYDPRPEAPDKTYARRGAFLDPVPFDALAFGIPPNLLPATDTSQLLALIVAQRVLDEASSGQFAAMNRDRTSVILGVTSGQELLSSMVSRLQRPVWVKSLREAGVPESQVVAICDRIASHYTPWQEASFPGLLGNVVAGRIANRFDLGGTNCVTDAACASALSALSMAANELYLGQSDLVITGGVDTLNDIFMYMCFSKTPALSRSGDCRPFSDQADGTMLGEGLAMVALKRLADAEAAGDRVYAVLRGVGSSSDGRAKSVYAPRPEGQAKALARAYEAAGYAPDTVELVEAHGTGTAAGDAAEFEGLTQVFEATGRGDRQWCAIGSVKSQIGHTKAAAGAAGMFKAIMALHHGVLPPTIKVAQPNPKLGLERSPFYVNTQARPWVRGSDHPRRASVSAFGFGGSNFHATLEEYRGPAPRALRKRVAPAELLLFAAEDAAALRERLSAVEVGGPGSLGWLARQSQLDLPRGASARLALLASDEADLKVKLGAAIDALGRRPGEPFSLPGGVHFGLGARAGGLAFLFPGQGSQYVGMGADLALLHGEALAAWDLAADGPGELRRLHQLVFPPPAFGDAERRSQEERLRQTEWAQPAIGAASLAPLELLRLAGLCPDLVGGHSFGEIVALHAAGVFDAAAMLRIARKRGELMAAAAQTPGAMTAVFAPRAEVASAVAQVAGVVIANDNAPSQVVLSGPVEAIGAAEEALRARSLRFERLRVATAFHSPVVAESAQPFGGFLADVPFAAPRLPVFANASAAPYPSEPGAMRTLLASQLTSSVRFVEQIEAMYAAGARTFVEVGPGSVLTGLVEQILRGRPHRAFGVDAKGRNGASQLQEALGRLHAAGFDLDLAPLWSSFQPTSDPRAAQRPKLALDISGANYGKPYPPPGGAASLPRPNPELASPSVAVAAMPAPASSPAPAPALAPAAAHGPLDPATLAAWQQLQRETLEAHTAWQAAMTQTHLAFLESAERSLGGLSGNRGLPAPFTAPQPALARPAFPPPTAPESRAPATFEPPLPAPRPTPIVAPLPAPAPAPSQSATELRTLMLAVVSEKTGYPAEMLTMEMALEADLGIDSIKRVEIMAALRERVPGLPDIDPAAMAALRTLGEIGQALSEDAPPTGEAAKHLSLSPHGGEGRVRGPQATDLRSLMLAVVSEKTGYPAEMLTMEMALEADLGIDSIKRVEIMAALRERVPGLPDIDPAAMAALRTLGEIGQALSGAPHAPLSPTGGEGKVKGQPAPPAAEPAAVHRFVVEAEPRTAPGLGLAGLATVSRLVVLDGGEGLAEPLVAALRGCGIEASAAEVVPADADAVIVLAGLCEGTDLESAARASRATFLAAKAVAPRFTERGGLFVTVQDTGGDFGLSGSERALLGGIAGIAKTAAVEWPLASVKAIDLARGGREPKALVRALVAELLEGGSEREIGLSPDGRRVGLRAVARPLAAERLELDERSVVVATGGARGVTAACLVELARAARCRFLLLGRTPLPGGEEPPAIAAAMDQSALMQLLADPARGQPLAPAELGAQVRAILAAREVRATIAAIHSAGGEARYAAADVRRPESVEAALAEARSAWGPITALVHGAGTLADKRIGDKTEAQFDAVFDTKVGGLLALLRATAGDPLRVISLFSSVAARFGNAGQCDYAAANEVLNKLAAREARARAGSCAVHAIGWGPWDGGMVTPSLRAHFSAQGTALIPLAAGAKAFVSELGATSGVELLLCASARPAPLQPAASGRSLGSDVLINARTHPYLADHSIEGVPVLPVVMALEWFARAAKEARPELEVAALHDLRVLRGARLSRFSNGGDRFEVSCRPIADTTRYALQLRGAGGVVHYEAVVELAERLPLRSTAPAIAAVPSTIERPERPIYGHELFHGPAFQVIRSLDGLSSDGAVATLSGTRASGWRGEWQTDAAALDGALQLALLWTGHVLGGRSLPTAVQSFRAFGSGGGTGPIRCVVRGRVLSDSRTVCDVGLTSQDGELLSELRGLELHKRPDPRGDGRRP